MTNTNAVIVWAGANSLHPHWLTPEAPEFDLYVLAYEPPPASPDTTTVREFSIPGRKIAGYNQFFLENPEILDRYSQIALIDNDILCASKEINEAFRVPIGGEAHLQGFVGEKRDYMVTTREVEQLFNAPSRRAVAYAALTKNGTLIKGRIQIAIFSLIIYSGLFKNIRYSRKYFMKIVTGISYGY